MNTIPRHEFPNPQFKRESWRNLNGEWDFVIDNELSGKERGFFEPDCRCFDKKIIVPFCPESELSGIGNRDFMNAVWYRRSVTVSEEEKAKRIVLHIGACDYKTEVFVNGKSVGTHIGGYVSFEFDISDFVNVGENVITIYAIDDTRNGAQPGGKQSILFASNGCHYTRTTGIWQTVWLEFTARNYIKSFKLDTDTENKTLHISGEVCGKGRISAVTSFEGKETGSCSVNTSGYFNMAVNLSELHLWELGKGGLYDLVLTLDNGGDTDTVISYFGMRSIAFEGMKFMLNGKSVFQRLVLDQGFYPDGIYTARDEKTLVRDIELSMEAGFNGARLHQKVFEPLFLYHCDRLGYIVWGEHASWGYDCENTDYHDNFLDEWVEILRRDVNHPAIVGWCPFNETWNNGYTGFRCLETTYKITKAFDPSRPCFDTSGGKHTIFTDVFDVHDYTHSEELLRKRYCRADAGLDLSAEEFKDFDGVTNLKAYCGQPFMNSEYGGIGFSTTEGGWGYNRIITDPDEYIDLFCRLTRAMLDSPIMFGFCYTQLTDVEQEQNGIYYYNREKKCDLTKIREALTSVAAIEK